MRLHGTASMNLFLVICQGCGLAAAAGIRPFLPALVAGAAASANFAVDFGGTDFAFMERGPFLLAVVVLLVLAVLAERRLGSARMERGPAGAAIAGIGLGLGALLFAGSLADEGYAAWPGIIGGLACAAVAQFAVRPLLRRVRERFEAADDHQAAAALTVYADGASLVLAVVSILLPPVGLVALVALIWLAISGRRREGEKYAGLRSLR